MREVDEDVEDAEVALFESHLEGLHVEPVAGENAAVIAPAGIRGGPAAAGVGAVDDVVVDQRGAVQQFDDGGEANGAAAGVRRRSECKEAAAQGEGACRRHREDSW